MTKQAEVEIGQIWIARVSGRFVRVRVDSIHKHDESSRHNKTTFGLTNLLSGRTLGARTAAFLRRRES